MSHPIDQTLVANQNRTFLIVCVCFLLSGFAALLYETVWLRQFAIILGTSEQALAVILGAYMGGLSFGAWVASRTVGSIRRPLLTYGILEAGIAACALAMPLGLILVQSLQVKLFGGAAEPPAAGSAPLVAFGLVSSFALILPPTAMMGATLPLLSKFVVRNDQELGPRIGLLYAINTLGAVAGTLSAAFVCLPALGLRQTTWVGAAINFAIFGLIWLGLKEVPMETSDALSNRAELPSAHASTREHESQIHPENASPIPYERVLWFAAISGAVSFCYEIVFTRMLGHSLGGSIFAFATMLAGFLLGIALGGAIASRLATGRQRAAVLFVYAQACTGILALAAFWMINQMSAWSVEGLGGNHSILAQVVISIAILLPSATFIGATFPLATRVFAKDERDASRGSAKVYFWNTIGAIAGSLLTGMYFLPHLAYHGATILAIVVNALIAMTMVGMFRIPKVHALAGVGTLACMLLFIPIAPENVLRVSALPGPMTDGDFVFNQVGRSATVTVFRQENGFRFQTNGLPEAAVSPRGGGPAYWSDSAWLATLPPLLRPGGKSMLIIGLGGGSAASYVPPSIEEVDVFELEPSVVQANLAIRHERRKDPLADPRVKIVLNDGRNGLALTSKKYDYIVSQPSHPWTAGASHLYTIEFNQTVRRRLKPGGVFLQWMDMRFVDRPLLQSMAASSLKTFDHVRIYEPTKMSLMFVSSDQPIEPEKLPEPLLVQAEADQSFYRQFGIQIPTDLIALLKMDIAALRDFVGDSPPITDEVNLLAMRAPRLLRSTKQDRDAFAEELRRWEPLMFHSNGLETLCPTIDYSWFVIASRARGYRSSSKAIKHMINPVDRALLESNLARYRGDVKGSEKHLFKAADLDPSDPRPAFLILSSVELGLIKLDDKLLLKSLRSRLDDRLGKLLQAVQLLNVPNNEGVPQIAEYDELLASFLPNEVGYEIAPRLRMIWRIDHTGPDRMALAEQALTIAREAAPRLGQEGLAFFQTIAAIQADHPHAALATVMTLATGLFERAQLIESGEVTVEQVKLAFPNLQKCRRALSDPYPFRSVSTKRYRETLLYLDNMLAGYPSPDANR